MEPLTLQFIADACGGTLRGRPELVVRGVCTDSRKVRAGDLFVALRGERFDGHDFLNEAAGRGAAAALVAAGRDAGPLPRVEVDDTMRALAAIAGVYRKRFAATAIAVGGSNGKSSVKELLASVLRQRFVVLWNEASYNNIIGVSHTLLRLEKSHQILVQEVGTNHPGELAPLLRLVQPRFAVLTGIGREHLEFFGDLHGVVEEEGTLAEAVPTDGGLFTVGGNPLVEEAARRCKGSVTRIGWGEGNKWQILSVRLDERGSTFAVSAPRPELSGEYRVNLLGRHQVANAVLALAVGAELGLGREELARGLAECAPLKMRLQLREVAGVRILDDAYNANADSMLAALQTLADFPCSGRRIAVLGDMNELGVHTDAAHREVGEAAARAGVDFLCAVGAHAAVTAEAARKAGLGDVCAFASVEDAATGLKKQMHAGDVVLIKASRAARLERIVEMLNCRDSVRL